MPATQNSKKTNNEASFNKKNMRTNIVEKKFDKSERLDSKSSVITKTRTPQIIIKSEHIGNEHGNISYKKSNYELLKNICLCIMGIIILITFFLTLKTYQMINGCVLLN